MRLTFIVLILSLVLLIPADVEASESFSGRSVGMCGAYTQAARGVESAFWNPANLGFSKSTDRGLTILSLGINAYNNALTLEQYNRYNGEFLTTDDKETILGLIPVDGLSGTAEASILGLGISWGNLALTLSGRGTSDLFLPKDPVEVLFFGNQINDTILINDCDGEAFASADLGLSYGRPVWSWGEKKVFCGVGVRYIRGITYQKVIQSQGELMTLETGTEGEGDFTVHSAQGGTGYGLDFGLAFNHNRNWSFGLSFSNLAGEIKWNRQTEERGYILEVDSLLADDFDLDSLVVDESYTQSIGAFTTRIPTVMRIGAAYRGERSLFTLDLKQGFKQGMGVYRKLRASLGAEYKFSGLLVARAGIAVGGNEGVTVANGMGLEIAGYHLDVGLAVQKGLWPTKSKGISLAITNGFNF
jgi:hypothetical protein